jgi:hypothetical protein
MDPFRVPTSVLNTKIILLCRLNVGAAAPLLEHLLSLSQWKYLSLISCNILFKRLHAHVTKAVEATHVASDLKFKTER